MLQCCLLVVWVAEVEQVVVVMQQVILMSVELAPE